MKQKLLDSLNRVSENLVLFDSVDLGPLGQIHNEFGEMNQLAAEAGNTELAKALSKMAEITENLIMSEDINMDKGIESLNKLVTLASEHLIDGSGLNEMNKLFDKISNDQFGDCNIETVDSDNQEDILGEFINSIEKDPEVSRDFVNESGDHLDNCITALLELEKSPDNLDCINLVFRGFHSIKGVAGFLNLGSVSKLSHSAEDLLDQIRSGKIAFDQEIANLLFEASDTLRAMIDQFSDLMSNTTPQPLQTNLKDLIERLRNMTQLVSEEKPEPHQQNKTVAPKTSAPALPRTFSGKKEVIKVDADKLNRLVDIIGELVVAETIVLESEETRSHKNPDYLRKLSQLDKITRELQTTGMSMRMVPVKSIFNNMAKIVRDLSNSQGKQVNFTTSGEETEIDKNIVDKLSDPLVHMVRNAVDHGIESSADQRRSMGKSPKASIEINASHRGGNVCIEIKDDGRGIDPDVIFKKAVEKELVSPNQTMSSSEIINLIFAPGFSTAENITEISGRGVGMDVVKKNISELNGTVEISSELGKGSVFTIQLPLTMAIIDGMVVRMGNERYIVPTLSISKVVNIPKKDIHRLGKREFLLYKGRNIAIYRLNRYLGIPDSESSEGLMLVVDNDDTSAGLLVDELVGKQQIVIKSLGEAFRNLEGYSGCAILSDGNVGLIIDVSNVIKKYDADIICA